MLIFGEESPKELKKKKIDTKLIGQPIPEGRRITSCLGILYSDPKINILQDLPGFKKLINPD
jgi:hypothetical protein